MVYDIANERADSNFVLSRLKVRLFYRFELCISKEYRINYEIYLITGKPKGQGQDDQVLFNRHKKNVNKSFTANHNRRKQAQNKRMRGMLPS